MKLTRDELGMANMHWFCDYNPSLKTRELLRSINCQRINMVDEHTDGRLIVIYDSPDRMIENATCQSDELSCSQIATIYKRLKRLKPCTGLLLISEWRLMLLPAYELRALLASEEVTCLNHCKLPRINPLSAILIRELTRVKPAVIADYCKIDQCSSLAGCQADDMYQDRLDKSIDIDEALYQYSNRLHMETAIDLQLIRLQEVAACSKIINLRMESKIKEMMRAISRMSRSLSTPADRDTGNQNRFD